MLAIEKNPVCYSQSLHILYLFYDLFYYHREMDDRFEKQPSQL